MSFVATLDLEAYDTFADAQIAVPKAANAEGFCVKSLRSKVGSSKWKTVWLGCSHGGIERKVMVFGAQVLIDLVAHGASSYGRAEKKAAGKLR